MVRLGIRTPARAGVTVDGRTIRLHRLSKREDLRAAAEPDGTADDDAQIRPTLKMVTTLRFNDDECENPLRLNENLTPLSFAAPFYAYHRMWRGSRSRLQLHRQALVSV
jgi:hypothetical protein